MIKISIQEYDPDFGNIKRPASIFYLLEPQIQNKLHLVEKQWVPKLNNKVLNWQSHCCDLSSDFDVLLTNTFIIYCEIDMSPNKCNINSCRVEGYRCSELSLRC